MYNLITNILKESFVGLVFLLIIIAFFTLAERKIMASVQRRKGPNITGFLGILQPFADGLKLILKEIRFPSSSNKFFFRFSVILYFFFSLMGWVVFPFSNTIYFLNFETTLLYFMTISSFSVFSFLFSGFASNSKFAVIGVLRGIAQLVTYELLFGLCFLCVIFLTQSVNLIVIVEIQEIVWLCIPLYPVSIIFFISCLAETNRIPFDLPEAEAELVAGYNVEYSGILFALFFLAEYSNILLTSGIFVILFLGGWIFFPFSNNYFFTCIYNIFLFDFNKKYFYIVVLLTKTFFICYMFIWIRAILPRYRIDQFIFFAWVYFIPFLSFYLLFLITFFLMF